MTIWVTIGTDADGLSWTLGDRPGSSAGWEPQVSVPCWLPGGQAVRGRCPRLSHVVTPEGHGHLGFSELLVDVVGEVVAVHDGVVESVDG